MRQGVGVLEGQGTGVSSGGGASNFSFPSSCFCSAPLPPPAGRLIGSRLSGIADAAAGGSEAVQSAAHEVVRAGAAAQGRPGVRSRPERLSKQLLSTAGGRWVAVSGRSRGTAVGQRAGPEGDAAGPRRKPLVALSAAVSGFLRCPGAGGATGLGPWRAGPGAGEGGGRLVAQGLGRFLQVLLSYRMKPRSQ